MSNIKLVIDFCILILNTKLSFPPYSFTILQAFIAFAIIGILVLFVRNILN